MLKKQTLDKNILTGKPQMCMLTIIIRKLKNLSLNLFRIQEQSFIYLKIESLK